MARTLIIGCGDIGSALGLGLVRRSHPVWGLRRRIERLPAGIEGIRADLSDPQNTPDLPSALDFIFVITAADRFDQESYRRAYLDVVRNLISLVENRQPQLRRIFFVSSTGVYGEQGGEWVDEETPPRGESFSGKILRETEEVLLESHLPVTVVRSAGIYGPGRNRTIQQLQQGSAVVSKNDHRYVNLIHRDDLVGALEHLMQLESPADLYLAVDHQPVQRNQLLRWLAHQLGVPEPLHRDEPEARRRNTGNKRCCNRRLLETGFEFTYPTYKEGYPPLLLDQVP